jgi:glutathione synthase/RimK-type ligase-like ATP-grasp enzyme
MTVIFATCADQPSLTADDALVAAALATRGIEVSAVPWAEIDPFATLDAPPVVLRSTWDYHRMPTFFLSWLQGMDESARPMWNDAATARGNVDKIYLRELEARGIEIPRTCWLDDVERTAVAATLTARRWDRAVLKPRIAATAHGTFMVTPDAVPADEELAPARRCGALLQEFVPEIVEHGELSLVYVDGKFSHAVIRRATAGDFRVQSDFGGTVERVEPSATARAFGDRVVAAAAAGTLYARVDVVESSRGPRLMELELIEPELYFAHAPEAADAMAEAIVRRL